MNKKMNKKIITTVALSFICLIFISGCGSTSFELKKGDTLRVGVCPDYPPVIFDDNGKISGIEADLAQYAGDKLGVNIEFVELPFQDLTSYLEDEEIDVIMSGMANTDYRKNDLRFIAPYMTIGQMALVRKKEVENFSSYSNLYQSTHRVGYIESTTGEMFVKENMKVAEKIGFLNPEKAIEELKNNEIDVFFDDAPFILQAVKNNPGLSALGWLFTTEQLAWAVSKDESRDGLYKKLNNVMQHARQSGDLRKVINKYFEIQVNVKK